MSKVELYCDIVAVTPGFEYPNYDYIVEDSEGVVVSQGTSSSEEWVKHDAGGYHTERVFNDMFGFDNWHVNFRLGFQS